MSGKVNELIEFIKFTHQFRNVERAIVLESDERYENDMEHSYQLALTAWYLIEENKWSLDKFKCVGMSLLHDLVEVYAGDIPAYKPEYNHANKAINEEKAAKKIKKQWPNFTSLHELIDEYEECRTPEAHFVYALDKLIPIINNYTFGGRTWKKEGLDLDWVKNSKVGKIKVSPEANEYWQGVLKLLEKNPQLFGKNRGEL